MWQIRPLYFKLSEEMNCALFILVPSKVFIWNYFGITHRKKKKYVFSKNYHDLIPNSYHKLEDCFDCLKSVQNNNGQYSVGLFLSHIRWIQKVLLSKVIQPPASFHLRPLSGPGVLLLAASSEMAQHPHVHVWACLEGKRRSRGQAIPFEYLTVSQSMSFSYYRPEISQMAYLPAKTAGKYNPTKWPYNDLKLRGENWM